MYKLVFSLGSIFMFPTGSWRFQPSKGTPPPCNGFSFVLFQNNYVFKYGGTEPGKELVSKVHILDLTQPVWVSLVCICVRSFRQQIVLLDIKFIITCFKTHNFISLSAFS